MRTTKHSLHRPPLARQHKLTFRLERWHKLTLYGIVTALFCSGCVWLVAHYFMSQETEFGAQNSPLSFLALKIHAFFVMPFCILLGSLLLQHIRRAFKAKINFFSGMAMLAFLFILILTAYGLDYLADERSHPIWSSIHWLIGGILPIGLWLHIRIGRRSV